MAIQAVSEPLGKDSIHLRSMNPASTIARPIGLFETMFSRSLVALVTPMSPDGAVDFASLESLVEFHIEQGTDALVIAGTTGESATLKKPEHLSVVEAALRYARGRVPVVAGTGSNSTDQTIDLSQAVGELPIDAYLVVTPYYNKPTQEGLFQHFMAIADAVEKPVMLYNVPGRTAVDLLPETVAKLAEHPRIFGIKEATGELDRVKQIKNACEPEFRLYSGDDPTAREFMLRGGHGVVSVTANVAPAAMRSMCEAALSGDAELAADIDEGLASLHRELFIESNPIPVKWVLHRLGLIPEGIRLPLTILAPAHQAAVDAALQRAGLIEG